MQGSQLKQQACLSLIGNEACTCTFLKCTNYFDAVEGTTHPRALKMAEYDSDYDSDIARMNEEDEPRLSLEERAKAYEKDGIDRIIRLWKRYVIFL